MPNSEYVLPPSPVLIPAQRLLRGGLPPNTPLLYALLGSGTPPYKMSQSDALYIQNPPGSAQTCGNCDRSYQHVGSKAFICDQIRGTIIPAGWCRLWVPARTAP